MNSSCHSEMKLIMTLLVKTCSDLLITELTATPAVHFSKLKQLPLTFTDLQVLFLLAQHCRPGLHGEILPGLHSEADYKGEKGAGAAKETLFSPVFCVFSRAVAKNHTPCLHLLLEKAG